MLDLNIVKQHLRLEPDITDDDELLRLYTRAAVAYVEQWTRRKLYMTREDDGFREDPDSLLLTDNVRAALLLLVAFWYENREPAGMGEISETPFAVEALLQPYRIYGL
ncbi:phage gp6-like head-tail connector protein [Salmonella enterica subsp. enterica]|nr:phage gp6-like head-tail connector protein [Salmonella enterica subsp. enterica serovar Abony]EKL8054168.1 phage gp6-like head-tail connector protein [Salmonella enterica]